MLCLVSGGCPCMHCIAIDLFLSILGYWGGGRLLWIVCVIGSSWKNLAMLIDTLVY